MLGRLADLSSILRGSTSRASEAHPNRASSSIGGLARSSLDSLYETVDQSLRCRDDGMSSILRYFVTVRRATG